MEEEIDRRSEGIKINLSWGTIGWQGRPLRRPWNGFPVSCSRLVRLPQHGKELKPFSATTAGAKQGFFSFWPTKKDSHSQGRGTIFPLYTSNSFLTEVGNISSQLHFPTLGLEAKETTDGESQESPGTTARFVLPVIPPKDAHVGASQPRTLRNLSRRSNWRPR